MTQELYKTMVYIDAANLNANVGRIDYKIMKSYLSSLYGYQLLGVKIFIPVIQNFLSEKEKYFDFLSIIGYSVFKTRAIQRETGFRKYKDNSDLVIAVEMDRDLRSGNVEKFVLMSGDRDFMFMLDEIKQCGKRVDIFGPATATCKEFRCMRGFKMIESIDGILRPEFTH